MKYFATILLFFCFLNSFSQVVFEENNLYGLKKDDKIIISPECFSIIKFKNKYILYVNRSPQEFLLVDSVGKKIISKKYHIKSLKNGLLAIKENENDGYFLSDENGNAIGEKKYQEIYEYWVDSKIIENQSIPYIFCINKDSTDVFINKNHIKNIKNRIIPRSQILITKNESIFFLNSIEDNQQNGEIVEMDHLGNVKYYGKGNFKLFENYIIINNLNKSQVLDYNYKTYNEFPNQFIWVGFTEKSFIVSNGLNTFGKYGLRTLNNEVIVPNSFAGYNSFEIGKSKFVLFGDCEICKKTLVNENLEIIYNDFIGNIQGSETDYAIYSKKEIRDGEVYERFGLVNSKGIIIIPPVFSKVEYSSEGKEYIFDNGESIKKIKILNLEKEIVKSGLLNGMIYKIENARKD